MELFSYLLPKAMTRWEINSIMSKLFDQLCQRWNTVLALWYDPDDDEEYNAIRTKIKNFKKLHEKVNQYAT